MARKRGRQRIGVLNREEVAEQGKGGYMWRDNNTKSLGNHAVEAP